MSRPWVWTLLFGFILGAGAGFGISRWKLSTSPGSGSPLLQGFSIQAFAERVVDASWEVAEDKTYSPWPPKANPTRIQRRIVAQAALSNEQLATFVGTLDDGIEQVLQRFGAQQTGEQSLNRNRVQSTGRSELVLPRYYYRIGPTYGVLDAWVVGNGGEAVVVICITE
jgi:hypothetical protein